MTGDAAAVRVAVVVVTYDRAHLLEELLASIAALTVAPAHVVVVDNASSDDTPEVLARWTGRLPLEVVRLTENTGGAGGFSTGVERAYATDADWLWLMDDDVAVLPDALDRLAPWMARFRCLTGRKYDYDGRPFRWQNRFDERLGVPRPLAGDPYGAQGWFPQTAGNFEGMMIHRDVVARIGLPDPRFFIVWDDAVYGWLAHLATESAVVDAFVLRRTRELRQQQVGARNLNATSDLYRFHVMRNRAYVRGYLRAHGRLNAAGFAAGTAYTFAKEAARLVLVERRLRGIGRLVSGWLAARALMRDTTWRPMPPLEEER